MSTTLSETLQFHALGSLVGLETDFALKIITQRFVDLGGNSAMSEEEAEALSEEVSWDSTAQAAVFLWWRRGMPPIAEYSFGARLVKPLETFWIWLRLNVFGGTGVSTSSRLGCAAVALFFLLFIAIVAWLVFSGGDEVPATATSTTTTTTTTTSTTTSTTLPPGTTTSKTVSFDLPCPQPVGGQSWIDVNIPADAVNPTYVVSPSPWTCPNTNVSVSGQVTSPGVYRVLFTATAGSGAPGETVSTTVTVNWTNP